MKSIILVLLILAASIPLFGQGTVAKEIGKLINDGEIDKAEERVNFYLKADSNDVDAIMMQGNVLLNRLPRMKGGIVVGVNEDESIYERTIGYIGGSEGAIVPQDLARKVANIWKHALTIDGRRRDIHFGVCQIYSIGLLTDELIAYLPTLKKAITGDDKLFYSMGDYARNMKERGKFGDAMKVYKAIFRLYPDQCGVLSDIAGEYFEHGNLDSAVTYVRRAIKGPNCDTMCYGNGFFILSVTGRYEEALGALTVRSSVSGTREYLLYRGLCEYLHDQPGWKQTLEAYATHPHDQAKGTLADILLADDYRGTGDDYRRLNGAHVDDGWKIILHQIFRRLSPRDLAPWFNYAELLTHAKSYAKADVEFAGIEKSGLVNAREDSENVAFYYGWVLWNLGRREDAISRFGKLLASGNFYYKSAAAYFIGKHYRDLGQGDLAQQYFRIVSDEGSKSKYATYCWNLLKK